MAAQDVATQQRSGGEDGLISSEYGFAPCDAYLSRSAAGMNRSGIAVRVHGIARLRTMSI